MNTLREFLDDLWLDVMGYQTDRYSKPNPQFVVPFDCLVETEWNPEFERLMRNRLLMGAYRYGPLGNARKKKWDRVEYMRRKLDEYETVGNLETLVDIANLALVEFVEGDHPNKHFSSKGDHNEHAKEKV